MDKKINFAISSLSLKKNEPNAILDNYIKINNPQYITKKNKLFRESREDYVKVGKYVDEKYQRYLSILSSRLNEIHNSSYSHLFWKQFFYLGLKRYITLVYEFFKQIETRFDHKLYGFRIIESEEFYIPFDLEDLRDYLSNSEHAQEQLFSIYYKLFLNDKEVKTLNSKNTFNKKEKINSQKIDIIDINDINQNTEILIFDIGCNLEELKDLSFITNKKFSILNLSLYSDSISLNCNKKSRDYLSSKKNDFDKFDRFFFETTKTLFPRIAIENFNAAVLFYNNTISFYPNLKYCISEYWISNHQTSLFIALLREKGVKLIYNEHNGLNHPFLNNWSHDLLSITDYYLTQGWYNKSFDKGNLIKSGFMHYEFDCSKKNPYSLNNSSKDILYMTAPAYVKRTNFSSIDFFMGEDSQYYFEFQKKFFNNLSKDILNHTIYRNAPILYRKNWLIYNSSEILKDKLNHMKLDTRSCSGLKAMSDSKLVIIDYLGSAYLQSFMYNIPTIIFLHQTSFLEDSFHDLFDELISVGIIQTNPINAANFILKIEKEPLKWWLSENVQNAKNNFLKENIQGSDFIKETFISFLEKNRRKFMTKLNLQYYKEIDLYSDGDIENEILEIVKYAQDFTHILSNTKSWPILYHLTPHRKNLLEWYEFDKTKNLLEIGGGCGAFSGMFADKLKDVKVVELSKRRSEIIYNRHKNHNNLEIIVGNLNDIIFKERFDYVTLIGVLEYAGKFTQSNTPFKTFLEKAKSYLKPKGTLLLAIENKFGMKYWAGAKEDHTDKYFDSIENYPYNKEIQTFGKYELEELFKKIGFSELNFYYPYPDYKLPKIIYSDNYLPNIDEFFDIYSPNFDHERYVLFNESEAFRNIIKNKQFPFFSNSFLIEANL